MVTTDTGMQGSDPMQPPTAQDEPDTDWQPRPLSTRQAVEKLLPDGTVGRYNQEGQLLCHARRRDGNLCMSPIVKGLRVCRMHGGGSEQAKRKAALRLAELVDPAIATLAREMANADKSADKQRAANSILDRAGFGRQRQVEVADAKELLYQRLLALREAGEDETAGEEPEEIMEETDE